MKVSKILARLLTIVLVVLLCFMVAGAAGTPGTTSERKSSVTITFSDKVPPRPVRPPGGGGGGGGGRANWDFTTITDPQIPLDTVTIVDPEVPLANLGDLPKTGSDTGDVFVTLSLVAAGCAMLLAARRNGAGIMA